MSDLYSKEELRKMGVIIGDNVRINRTCQFYGGNIQIGENVRIDNFCVITSNKPVVIGNNVHISVGGSLFGEAGIIIEDFCGLSARCSIFSASDDYSEGYLTNPCIPDDYKKIRKSQVKLCKHVIIGCGSVVLPGVTIGYGASIGALSLVNKNIPDFLIVSGVPARKIGVRNSIRLMELEKKYETDFRDRKKNKI